LAAREAKAVKETLTNVMEEDQKSKKETFPDLISTGKDLVSLLRDSSLLVLAILLILFPSTLSAILAKAGFVEGSVAGFKWKANLVASDAALKEAQVTITDLQKKNDQFSKALLEAQTKINDPSLKEDISKLEEENRRLRTSTKAAQALILNTIGSNAALVDKELSATNIQRWGIIFGGDFQLIDAEYEANVIAPKLDIPNVGIFFRQGSFRSISLVESQELAQEVLLKAKSRRQDSYIVDMANWCSAPISKQGYTECKSP
jgi:hypothetical protein